MPSLPLPMIVVLAVAAALPARAIDVTIQYETPGDVAFFTPTARATLQKAAADVSVAVTTNLSALNQDVYTGTNGSASASVDWGLFYTDPNTGNDAPDFTTFNFLPNEFRVFVGSRDLPNVGQIGQGSAPGSFTELSLGGDVSQRPNAVNVMTVASDSGMLRGGPRLGTVSGSVGSGGNTIGYSLGYGFAIGSLTFDDMTNWNFDYNTMPTPSQNDFYSVAVHELLHTIGFGIGAAWNAQVSGANWLGPAVIDLLGTGTGVLDPGQGHVAEGLEGSPIIDGVYRSDIVQEAIMDPTLTTGSRKYITDLDLAFLKDMGWDVVAVPEPSTIVLIAFGGIAILATARRRASR